jgi:hypothetical protein
MPWNMAGASGAASQWAIVNNPLPAHRGPREIENGGVAGPTIRTANVTSALAGIGAGTP